MLKFGVTRSGVYQIDPDGPFDGSERPIRAYCDFEKGWRKKNKHIKHLTSALLLA